MVIDSSVLLAILFDEPERTEFIDRIDTDGIRLMSAVSQVETSLVVLGRKGPAGLPELSAFLEIGGIEIVPFDAHQAQLAVMAYQVYGKGRGHKARLNFGDCCAYALARASGEPLLFKGHDFGHTDIAIARPIQEC